MNPSSAPATEGKKERTRSPLFPVFAVFFAIVFLAVTVFPFVGNSGGEPMRHAATAYSLLKSEKGMSSDFSECTVSFLEKPEAMPENGIFPIALVAFGYGDSLLNVTVNNAGEATLSEEEASFKVADTARVAGGFLFDLRFVYLRGMLGGVVFPESISPSLLLVLFWLGSLLVGYLFGGVNTGILISRLFFRRDIRKEGSGNAGTTNMLRTFGVGPALLTLLGDVLKVFLALTVTCVCFGSHNVAGFCGNGLLYLTGVGAILGHIFPIYHRFKGGKGVASTAAMALYTAPVVALILILFFVAMVALTRYISMGSISAAMLYPVVLNGILRVIGITADPITMLSTVLVAILIILCHSKNISRLMKGTENKLSFKRKSSV